jgi:hypothetical protein
MVKRWLAKRLRPFVEKYDPIAVASAPVLALPAGASRFRVLRDVDGSAFTLYDGPLGAEARRWWEHVRFHRERGRMEFWQNDVRRDVYEG